MSELTLESLAARVAELERRLGMGDAPAVLPATRDWREVIGRGEHNEFTRAMWAEVAALREAERDAARRGSSSDPTRLRPPVRPPLPGLAAGRAADRAAGSRGGATGHDGGERGGQPT
jgi:hypothetical protein